MYKVFLVEDEIVVRDAIRDQVPWDTTDFQLIGEASDGEMALPMIEELRPDILITDVMMPFMNGLQLSHHIKKFMPFLRILILSGYDEFSFAKEAIQVPVDDYLLKPLGVAELLNSLEKIKTRIEQENETRKQASRMEELVSQNWELMVERFLGDIASCVLNAEAVYARGRELGLDLDRKWYKAALLEIVMNREDGNLDLYRRYIFAERRVYDMVADTREVLCFHRKAKEIVLIFPGDNEETTNEYGSSLSRSLKYELERSFPCLVQVTLGRSHEGINGISASLAEAENAREFRHIFGNEIIIDYKDMEQVNFRSKELLSVDSEPIIDQLRYGAPDAVEAALKAFVEKLYTISTGNTINKYPIADLLLKIGKTIESLGGDVEKILPALSVAEQKCMAGVSSELIEFLMKPVRAALELRENRKKDKYGDTVKQAKKYIMERHTDADLSLSAAANHVNMSSSHFSTIFSHESKETFIECLTRTRVQHAMELLKSSNLRTSEIAFAVGYTDPHYFSHVFKKHTGIAPKTFRGCTDETSM